MAGGRRVLLALLALLALQGVGAVKLRDTIIQSEFYQRNERLRREDSEFLFDFNGDEIFHVDLGRTETMWRLPSFSTYASFEAQGALQNMAINKQNLEHSMKRFNRSQATIVPPEVTMFPKHQVELENPNILTCYVDKFWPPVLSITWLKNGQEVTGGVLETVFYPRDDNTFRKFSYLPFIPARGEYYDCRVKIEGLPTTFSKHWEPQVPLPLSESTETLVCALGLAVGIVGIVVGTILIIKAMKMSSTRNQRGIL